MIKEYRTMEEVAGPLMLVRRVDGVKYDELGEIELESGEVRPTIFRVFPIQQAEEAQALMQSGKHVGKIVLKVK